MVARTGFFFFFLKYSTIRSRATFNNAVLVILDLARESEIRERKKKIFFFFFLIDLKKNKFNYFYLLH
jgi:hypothetical protein